MLLCYGVGEVSFLRELHVLVSRIMVGGPGGLNPEAEVFPLIGKIGHGQTPCWLGELSFRRLPRSSEGWEKVQSLELKSGSFNRKTMGGTEGCLCDSEGCLAELRLKEPRQTRRVPSQDTHNRATRMSK